jgi:hypothetical protein
MNMGDINYLAIIVAAVGAMVVCGI